MKDIMTAPQVAKWLGMNPATVRRLTAQNKMPGRKIGKQYRYSRRAIEDWIRDPK